MTKLPKIRMHRYLSGKQFADELKKLKAYRGAYVGDGLLEELERDCLVLPRLRLRWPDEVARRIWSENHSRLGGMHEPVEPDGPRWDAAVRLYQALDRWTSVHARKGNTHPFDDPEPEFAQFLQQPDGSDFRTHMERRMSVANETHSQCYDGGNIQDYYSSG